MTDDLDLAGSPYVVWVEGRATVHPWEEDKRVQADALHQLATPLGLAVFRRPLAPEGDDKGRRRWTYRRITSEDVLSTITRRPAISFSDLVEALYRENPWTDERKRVASSKLRVSLSRLRTSGKVVKRYDSSGVERWALASIGTGLLTSVAGVVPEGDSVLPYVPLDSQIMSVVELLKQLCPTLDTAQLRDLTQAVWYMLQKPT